MLDITRICKHLVKKTPPDDLKSLQAPKSRLLKALLHRGCVIITWMSCEWLNRNIFQPSCHKMYTPRLTWLMGTYATKRFAIKGWQSRPKELHGSTPPSGQGGAWLCFASVQGKIWGVCVGPGSLETGRPGRPTAYYILYVCVCVSEWVWDDFCDSNAQRAKQRRHELQNTCAASGCPPLKCPWQSSRPSTNPNIKVPSVFSLRYPFVFSIDLAHFSEDVKLVCTH